MATAWIAIVGTIIGASTSYLFQRLTLRRTESFARGEQLRARLGVRVRERLDRFLEAAAVQAVGGQGRRRLG
jgi:hypothetical protein